MLVADDQHFVRAGFRMILEGEPDMLVVGEAGDGLEALDLAASAPPTLYCLISGCPPWTASQQRGGSSRDRQPGAAADDI